MGNGTGVRIMGGQKSYEILGYNANCSTYCIFCAVTAGIADDDYIDAEGNEAHPIFAGDEDIQAFTCDCCGEWITED